MFKWCLLKITLQAPFLNVQMMSVHISSGLVLHQMTSDHNRSELRIQDHSNEPSSSKLVPKVVPLAVKTATSRQELELLFHHHIAMLRTTVSLFITLIASSSSKSSSTKGDVLDGRGVSSNVTLSDSLIFMLMSLAGNKLTGNSMAVFTLNLYHDGFFVPNPLKYVEGGFKVVNDIRNDENIADYVSEKYDEDPENIDFHVEGEQDVVFQKLSIDDPFLTKQVGKGNFIGTRDNSIPLLSGKYILKENDSDDDLIDGEYKIKKGVKYPSYNPKTTWDEFQPILVMNFENPLQLKNALADYDVKHGYQLWYYRSDYKSSLVYYGKDIELGICAGRRGMKKKKKGIAEGDKVKGKQVVEESDLVKGNREAKASLKKPMKWTRMMVLEHKGHHYPFRLWASWMSSERSFQIKTLYSNHMCTRNYNIGSLVMFRWIARHYARDIILISAISYKFMREDIREKYIVDVSLDYQQAVLDSNPGLTCHLDVDVHDNGQNCFHRFYACFKGVKDGWLSGCRKVIRIDGCFITHVCKATSTIKQDFTSKMGEIRALDEEACAFLMEREPATLCKAYFQTATRCASFENGISKSMLKYFLLEFSIKPAYGSKMCQSTINTPPLPPIVKTMPGRPRKNRIKHPSHNKNSYTNPKRDKPIETDRPPRPAKSCIYTTSKNKKGGISINDICKTKKQVGESNKRGGGSFSRGRGTATMDRGSTSMCKGSANKRGGSGRSATMGRGSSNKKGRSGGSASMGRGSQSERGGFGGSATTGRGTQLKRGRFVGSASMGKGSQSKRGGSATMGKGSRSKRSSSARKGCDDSNNTHVMDEEERQAAEREQRLDSDKEHNGRIYQD
ncbi:hypothetical protein Tco_0196498 [Tanacetum coccineum]